MNGGQVVLILWAIMAGLGFVIWSMLPIGVLMSYVGTAIEFPRKPKKMTPKQYKELKGPIPGGAAMGFFERLYFFVVLAAGAPVLVGVWLAFKVASKWDAWSNIYRLPDKIEEADGLEWFLIRRSFGAKVYQRFAIGTAVNFLAAAIGAGIVRGTIWFVECVANGGAEHCPTWL